MSLKAQSLVLLVCIQCFPHSDGFLSFLCAKPNFTTITKKVSGEYMMVDIEGRYWTNITSDSVFAGPGDLRRNKSGDIKNIRYEKQTLGDKGIYTLDLLTGVTFDGNCASKAERALAIKHMPDGQIQQFTAILSDPTNADVKSGTPYGLDLRLKHNKRVNFILNFHLIGIFLVQGKHKELIFCDKQRGWQYYNKTIEELIIFDPKIDLGQIIGGFVAPRSKTNDLYLFGGQLTSSFGIVRKFIHQCNYKIIEGLHPKSINISCKEINIDKECTKGAQQSIEWLDIALIVCVATLVVLITILLLICFLKREQTNEKGKLNDEPILRKNRRRIFGNTKPLGQFARKYDDNEEKTSGLSRKRVLR